MRSPLAAQARGAQQLVSDFGHGADHDDGLLAHGDASGNDGRGAADGRRIFDRRAAELHDNQAHASLLIVHHAKPRAAVSATGFQLTQACQQFGVQDGGSGGSANGVVREHGELPVEHVAGAQAADGDGHAVAAIAIEARLRAIRLRSPLDGLIGSGGQILAGERLELGPCGQNVFASGGAAELVAQLDGDALGVAVFDGDAIAAGADARGERRDGVALELAQQLERLGFHLLFFAADVGNDVAEDVHRRHAGIARAADGLHGGDKDLLDAEALFDGLERHAPGRWSSSWDW